MGIVKRIVVLVIATTMYEADLELLILRLLVMMFDAW